MEIYLNQDSFASSSERRVCSANVCAFMPDCMRTCIVAQLSFLVSHYLSSRRLNIWRLA